jgi:hypothetical protein
MFASIRKFIKSMRRKEVVAQKRCIDRLMMQVSPSRRNILKKSAHYKFLALWKKQHSTGIRMQDDTLATIEFRWVRKALRQNPSLASR